MRLVPTKTKVVLEVVWTDVLSDLFIQYQQSPFGWGDVQNDTIGGKNYIRFSSVRAARFFSNYIKETKDTEVHINEAKSIIDIINKWPMQIVRSI